MTTLRDRPRQVTKWKQSRLLAGGAIVLIGALWTGPQMAAAAPAKSKPAKGTTTTTAAPKKAKGSGSTTTTTAKPGKSTKPKSTTTTTAKPGKGTTTTTAAPGKSADNPGQGNPPAPPAGNSPGNAAPQPQPAVAPAVAPSAAPVDSAPAAGSIGPRFGDPLATRTPRRSVARVVPKPEKPATPDIAVPPADVSDSTLHALRGPDRAAQATVRSINGAQGVPAQGGTALYAQLASTSGPLPIDDYPGNPYLVFMILVVFGIGVGLTGRRRLNVGAAAA